MPIKRVECAPMRALCCAGERRLVNSLVSKSESVAGDRSAQPGSATRRPLRETGVRTPAVLGPLGLLVLPLFSPAAPMAGAAVRLRPAPGGRPPAHVLTQAGVPGLGLQGSTLPSSQRVRTQSLCLAWQPSRVLVAGNRPGRPRLRSRSMGSASIQTARRPAVFEMARPK